eukprot:COSAG02_NODE_39718_length_413_cov_2.802548_1_plen_52_part_10
MALFLFLPFSFLSCWDTLLLGVSGVRFRNSLLWEFLELPNSLYLNPSSLSLL